MPPPLTDRHLPQRVRIERVTRIKDGRGGFRETAGLVAAAQRCRMGSAFLAQFQETDGQLVSQPTRYAYFDPDADVQVHDILHLTSEGRRFVVQGAELQADGVYRKVNLTEEQPG